MRHIFGFGHSHWNAIRVAADARGEAPADGWKVTGLDLGHPHYSPWIEFPDGVMTFNPNLLADIEAGAARLKPDLLFSVLDGADYIPYAIVQNPRPFDVVVPHAPDLPRIEGAELIPYDLVRGIFMPNLRVAFQLLRIAGERTGMKVVHFSPPPPVASDDHIRAWPGDMLRASIAEFGLAPALLRYKLWLVFIEVIRDVCTANGADFIPPPPESIDANGFMRQEFCADDPVHGNARYGGLVIQQMIRIASATQTAEGTAAHASV
jgi:hypothetical protein